METRKVQLSVQGSFILTLPKSWVHEVGLSKGDQVALETEDDGSLRVYAQARKTREGTANAISVESFPSMQLLDLCIKASYIQGNDITEIISKHNLRSDQKRWIKESIAGLVGTEIGEEFADKVVLLNLVDPLKFPIDTVLQRFSEVAKAIFVDAIDGVVHGDFDLARDAYERGKESARFYRLLMRQIIQCARNRQIAHQMGIKDIGEVIIRATCTRELSRLAYYAMRIAQHVIVLEKADVRRDLIETIEKMSTIAGQMHDKAMNAFLKMDINLAGESMEKMDSERTLFEQGMKQILMLKPDAKIATELALIIRDLRAIAGYAVAIADDAVLRAFAKRS